MSDRKSIFWFLCLFVIVGLSIFLVQGIYSGDFSDRLGTAHAISLCKKYHRSNNVDLKMFGGSRADVQDAGWFVVISTKNDGYRRCSVTHQGQVVYAN